MTALPVVAVHLLLSSTHRLADSTDQPHHSGGDIIARCSKSLSVQMQYTVSYACLWQCMVWSALPFLHVHGVHVGHSLCTGTVTGISHALTYVRNVKLVHMELCFRN